jgi:quercetin dioxygenase-like cupin family protein
MKAKQKIAALILLGIFSVVTQVQAQDMKMPADHIMVMPNAIKWGDAPPSLPPGAKVAVLEGDPKAAGLFTMRIKIPANYRIMPHSHPADEHVTVIKGTFYMGLGEKFDKKTAKEIPTGGFAMMNTGTRHYAFTKGECIIQLHGMGPWGIIYVNPADDPRNKK